MPAATCGKIEFVSHLAGELPALSGVIETVPVNRSLKLTLSDQTTPLQVLQELSAQNALVEKFEIAYPSLDEIFIQVVQNGGAG